MIDNNGNVELPQKPKDVHPTAVDTKSKDTKDIDTKKSQKKRTKFVSVTKFVIIKHENLDVKDMSKKDFKTAKLR